MCLRPIMRKLAPPDPWSPTHSIQATSRLSLFLHWESPKLLLSYKVLLMLIIRLYQSFNRASTAVGYITQPQTSQQAVTSKYPSQRLTCFPQTPSKFFLILTSNGHPSAPPRCIVAYLVLVTPLGDVTKDVQSSSPNYQGYYSK